MGFVKNLLFSWEFYAFILFLALVFLVYKYHDNERKVYPFQGVDYDEQLLNIHLFKKKNKNKKKKKKRFGKFEERCREILQRIYNRPFISCRPDFLKSPITNRNLEIDCFNEQLGIALEYDGKQHAEYTPTFHGSNKWNFIYQVKKDTWKDKKCEERGIKLIRVPHNIPFNNLEEYIRKKLKKCGKL